MTDSAFFFFVVVFIFGITLLGKIARLQRKLDQAESVAYDQKIEIAKLTAEKVWFLTFSNTPKFEKIIIDRKEDINRLFNEATRVVPYEYFGRMGAMIQIWEAAFHKKFSGEDVPNENREEIVFLTRQRIYKGQTSPFEVKVYNNFENFKTL